MDIRKELLAGHLPVPSAFNVNLGTTDASTAGALWHALWHDYLRGKGCVNTTYWVYKFTSTKAYNTVLMSLSNAGIVNSSVIPARRWAEVSLCEHWLTQYVSLEELEVIRHDYKYNLYKMTNTTASISNLTALNGRIVLTGLVRNGFGKAGSSTFTYDMSAITQEDIDTVQSNLIKGMTKVRSMSEIMSADSASYDEVSIDILEYHLANPDTIMTTGTNVSDSRGRAISSCLARVFNPIGSKDARALLTIQY